MVPVKGSKLRRWLACVVLAAEACTSPRVPGAGTPSPDPGGVAALDPATTYREAGLLVQGHPLPWVGSVRYLRGGSTDSTLMLVSLSLASQVLTFTGAGTQRRAAYDVVLVLLHEGQPALRDSTREAVRVASLAETLREDESVVFQRVLAVAPGDYTLRVVVRDVAGGSVSRLDEPVAVPSLGSASLAAPLPVYEATPRTSVGEPPRLISNPRGLVVYGRDTTARFYVEAYGPSDTGAVVLRVVDATGRELARTTTHLVAHGALSSGEVVLAVPLLGGGRLEAQLVHPGASDTTRTPLFAAVAEALGPVPLDELAHDLRCLVMPERLTALRDTSPERRAAAWTALLAAVDSAEPRGANEALRAYFARIAVANQRYGDGGSEGWLTDRGRVFVTLGEPDRVREQSVPGVDYERRTQVWDYGRYATELEFVDQTGFGQWRLTPGSSATFSQLANRVRIR